MRATHASVSEQRRLVSRDEAESPCLVRARGVGAHDISVYRFRFQHGASMLGGAGAHTIYVQLGPGVRTSCRIGAHTLEHRPEPGMVAICPADQDALGTTFAATEGLLVVVPTEPLAVLCAERGKVASKLAPQLAGQDLAFQRIALELVSEGRHGGAVGHELGQELLEHLAAQYALPPEPATRSLLSAAELRRINDYVLAHLDEELSLDVLADVAGRSRWQFAKVFRRSVGLSPHRYVVQLRLRQALDAIREGAMSLAQIASANGFVDQSHMTHWMRRVYGAPPSAFAPRRTRQESTRGGALAP